MTRVVIGYTDGRFHWKPVDAGEPPQYAEVEVPASTVLLWQEIDRLNAAVQRQLRELDNARLEGRDAVL